jgi:hypothetical protein
MKMRLVVTLAGLAIGCAVPSIAQDKNTVDPEVRQEIKAAQMKFDEAFNKRDTAGIAALYTLEAVQVLDEWEGGDRARADAPSIPSCLLRQFGLNLR